jgi:hypothetical protein
VKRTAKVPGVGLQVGSNVGEPDGLTVTRAVVGASVGAVGERVGALMKPVGMGVWASLDGRGVGAVVGGAEGDGVGRSVGASVGRRVKPAHKGTGRKEEEVVLYSWGKARCVCGVLQGTD